MRSSNELTAIAAEGPRFFKALEAMQKGVNEGVAPSMVAGVWQKSRPDEFIYFTAGAGELETIFDLASVTKVFSTATLFSLAVDRGLVEFTTPVVEVLPEWKHSREVTLEMLASHTAGLPAWAPF